MRLATFLILLYSSALTLVTQANTCTSSLSIDPKTTPHFVNREPQKRWLLSALYHLLVQDNAYKNKKSYVRSLGTKPSICQEEKDFLQKRDPWCNAAIKKLLGRDIELQHTPRIVLLSSGGGLRSALFTAGGLKTLSEKGVLDACQYVGGISGGTWAIIPWILSQKSFVQFYPEYIDHVVTGLLPKTIEQGGTNLFCFLGIIGETLLRRLAFQDVPSAIDLYGLLLSLHLLGEESKTSYATTNLASLIPSVQKGQNPLPLCTAIIPDKNKDRLFMDPIECTPFEVVDYSSNTAVPGWGCGREYRGGVSYNTHPPLTMGLLMGIFGSAFTAVTLKEIWPMIVSKLWPPELFAPLGKLIQETQIGDLRIFPEHVRNFSFGLPGATGRLEPFKLWVDAGISINVPIVPFLKQEERAPDIYIILDAGGDVKWSNILSETELYARTLNLPFPHCDTYAARSSVFSVFDDGPNAPIIVYIPMIYNPNYNQQFDPQDMMYNNRTGNFLSSDNFTYSQQQADLLAGLAEFSTNEHLQQIKDVIAETVQRKEQGLRPSTVECP
ncbi:MAG: hypothetical protein UV38_C0002G0227 [candidate division TM6 bacterium GW2011_GWE2_42_60]|nr:MAG: hypothetical protein UV38_C0002G0227 [candidate division TM6 bacterium GW2011_GWE2_42_60]HBY06021.1 hypothetical protein [Candidatus Dependentiae bacterium]